MILISFLLLFAPGIVCQWISGQYKANNWLDFFNTIIRIVVDDFIIVVGIAMLFYMIYGDIVYSFSPRYSLESSLTIYHVRFIVKYACLDVAMSVALGGCERLIGILYKRMRHKT